MSTEKVDIRRLSMFYPKTRKGLSVDYPELSKVAAFKNLNKHQLLFVWYYACKASPFYREEDYSVKAEQSLIESHGVKAAEGLMGKFKSGSFPEVIRVAIAEMSKFEVGPRIQAKLMVEKIMNNYFHYNFLYIHIL